MLYETWLRVARDQTGKTALVDGAAGEGWTFGDLAALAAQSDKSPTTGADERPESFACPQGNTLGFILTVLRGWRTGRIVCPLESGQTAPEPDNLPAGCVHLKTTSATTGKARHVAFTASQLAADAENIRRTMGLRPDSPNLGVISLAHSYGFSSLVLPLLLHGIPLHLLNSPLPEAVRQVLGRAENWTLPAVPAMWRAWHEAGILGPAIRLAISAGSPLPLPLEEAVFASSGLKLHNFYGATECGGIAYDRSTTPRADASRIGEAMEGLELFVNETSCLTVRGPAVGETYWPEAAPGLANGQYQTSDLAELRADGVWLRGRAGDLINIAGRKLVPESVEQALLAHPAVRECLVFGVPAPSAERAELIVACLVARPPVTTGALREFLLARLPAWQLPKEWRFVESLATGSRGKLSRAAWREKFLAGQL